MYIKNVLMDKEEKLYIDLTDLNTRLDKIKLYDDGTDPTPDISKETGTYASVVWGAAKIGQKYWFRAWRPACWLYYSKTMTDPDTPQWEYVMQVDEYGNATGYDWVYAPNPATTQSTYYKIYKHIYSNHAIYTLDLPNSYNIYDDENGNAWWVPEIHPSCDSPNSVSGVQIAGIWDKDSAKNPNRDLSISLLSTFSTGNSSFYYPSRYIETTMNTNGSFNSEGDYTNHIYTKSIDNIQALRNNGASKTIITSNYFYGYIPVYLYNSTGMKMLCRRSSWEDVEINSKSIKSFVYTPATTYTSVYLQTTSGGYLQASLPSSLLSGETDADGNKLSVLFTQGCFIREPGWDKYTTLKGIYYLTSNSSGLDPELTINNSTTNPYNIYYCDDATELEKFPNAQVVASYWN